MDDEDDEFYGGLDVDSMVQQQQRSQPSPAPSQWQGAAPPVAGTGHIQRGWQAGAQQQQQQQQHGQQLGQQHSQQHSQQQPAGGGGGPACCHGVPYAACVHRQQHLDEITKQASEAAMQMADAEGPQLQALQQEVKRLRGLKQLLEAVPPPSQAPAGPAASGRYGSQHMHRQPQQQRQQQHHQQQPGAPPLPSAQQQQWGDGGSAVGPRSLQPGGVTPSGAGFGAGPAGAGHPHGGGAAPSYAGPPSGGYGGASGYGGGAAGGYGSGDATYEQAARHEPWQVDEAALQDVAAVRQDATNDPKCAPTGGGGVGRAGHDVRRVLAPVQRQRAEGWAGGSGLRSGASAVTCPCPCPGKRSVPSTRQPGSLASSFGWAPPIAPSPVPPAGGGRRAFPGAASCASGTATSLETDPSGSTSCPS